MTDLTYKDEAMLVSWSDSAAGRKVTFLLPDNGEEHPFKGYKTGPTNGQAFVVACHPVDYDNPESPPEPRPGDPIKSVKGYAKPPMTESQRCGMLCGDTAFHGWLAKNFPKRWAFFFVGQNLPDDAAACVVRDLLKVPSRRDIDTNEIALTSWRAMLAQFEHDTGRIAEQTR
jgi:hypothetical protein